MPSDIPLMSLAAFITKQITLIKSFAASAISGTDVTLYENVPSWPSVAADRGPPVEAMSVSAAETAILWEAGARPVVKWAFMLLDEYRETLPGRGMEQKKSGTLMTAVTLLFMTRLWTEKDDCYRSLSTKRSAGKRSPPELAYQKL